MDKVRRKLEEETRYQNTHYREWFPRERNSERSDFNHNNRYNYDNWKQWQEDRRRDERNDGRIYNSERSEKRGDRNDERIYNSERAERRGDRNDERIYNSERAEGRERDDGRYDRRQVDNNDDRRIRRHQDDPSYVSTLRNYHPPGGRRIEPSREEDNEWQSNPEYPRDRRERDYDYDREARSYNSPNDYRWNSPGNDYSRYRRRDHGYHDDYDTDFFWQT
jgi:translation initiation factor IF-2